MFTKEKATNRLFVLLMMLLLVLGLCMRVVAEEKDPNEQPRSSEALHKDEAKLEAGIIN